MEIATLFRHLSILRQCCLIAAVCAGLATAQDTDRDGIPNSTDPFPTVNAVIADPDGNNNLSAGLQSGLIGRWDFETMAVSGTNHSFADIAGGDQPLNCRQLSMSIDNSGMISKGALFDAGNDHLAAPGTLFHNRTAFSTSMWFKIPPGYIQNKAGNIHTVFFACNDALDAYPELIVSIYKGVPGSTTQKITVNRYNGTTLTMTFFGEIPVADYLDDGFWNHLAFVKNGNNSRLFVNGVKIKESNITNPTLTATTAGYISYGKNVPVATDQGHTFRGSMDRIRFYSRNLSDAEVTELYRQDSDRDGFPDIVEKDWGTTYPLSPFYWQSPEQDSDQDGLPDFWERLYGLDPLNTTGINGGTGDGDGDGVTNINEFQNSTSPGKKDTDDDGVSDAIEISQGSDANSAADSGKPPTDPLESVTFRTGGDYATWQMNITGLGPRDFRKLQVTAPKFNDFITVTHKLRKNNSYQIKLTHTGSRPDQPDTWYCWEAQVNGFPTTASFTTSAANTLGIRTTTGLATVINNHWVVDNTSGLLTSHLHSKSINKVSSLTTYLLPVEVVEVSPLTKDEEGNDIAGSQRPSTGRPFTPFVELNPVADRIAHRELKVKIGAAMKGKTVTWTLDAVPDATPATIRGRWNHSTTHPDRFETSAAYGANGFTRLSQESGRTTVADDGFTAIRVNVPPVGFNKVRIRIQIEGVTTLIDLIDMEVPGVVVIDPGHGGTANLTGSNWNNATSPSGVLEKAMALNYGLALRDSLRGIRDTDRLNLRIFMTRNTDTNETGAFRAAKAKDNGADIINIIHFNASDAHTARGTLEVYRTTSNVFPQQDTILSEGIITRMVTAMTPFDAGANHRARVANDTAVASDGNNGNTAAYCPVRTSYIEVEFIDFGAQTTDLGNDAVDILLNTGPNAGAVKTAIANAMRDGILHDLRNHQPQP
jgi:N-acetylmuramoyl-L-alanine amidase